jgi:hypothetical protein
VDGKSDWCIMKDFDWLQVHINDSFKNSSVKATIKVKLVYQIPLTNFFEFLFLLCFMAENKSTKQYFERALSKSLTKFGHTTLKEQQNY